MAFTLKTQTAEPLAPPVPLKPTANRSILFGTGLTQKTTAKAVTDIKHVESSESRLDEESAKYHAEEVAAGDADEWMDDHQLPTTLVDESMQPDEHQQMAIDGLLNQQFGCMIGAAGTGKTTAMKWLIHAIIETVPDADISFCSFTGRAVQQMKRALPKTYHKQCDTIHGLLEYAPEEMESEDADGNPCMKRIFVPHRDAMNPVDANIIIVDEAGMCVIELWNNLMKALRDGTRVYLLGDINQLPPPMGRSVLGFAMQAWPTYELKRIHRTDESGITDGAWDILNGKLPKSVPDKVALMRVEDGSTKAFMQTLAVTQKLSEAGKFNCLRDGIIVPQNVGPLGQEAINERLVAYFNPTREVEGMPMNPRTIITAGYNHIAFAVGDKVMVTQNDRQQGLTNGMIGVIEAITPNAGFRGDVVGDSASAHLADDYELDMSMLDNALDEMAAENESVDEREIQCSHTIRMRFQNVEMPIDFASAGAVNSLKHAYAFTCHKSQGGEYPVVVILVHSANVKMLSREWLYTAWTRAQKKVILLYNSRGIQQALNRQVIKGTSIAEKAESFIKLQARSNDGDMSIKMPMLPERVELGE